MALFDGTEGRMGGRAKGTPNKKTLLRAAAVLADKGISPADKLSEIADSPETPLDTRISLWKFLQSYVEAPQTLAVTPAPDSPEDSVERAKVMADRLATLSRPLDPTGPPAPQP